MRTYQSEVMTRNKELSAQNVGLVQTQKELETANQSLEASIKALQIQPPALSMTTRDEQELLDLLNKKDKLIETLEITVTQMRESLIMLNVYRYS